MNHIHNRMKIRQLEEHGGSGSGSTVSVSQTLSSGTEIGAVTVDGRETKLYAPTATEVSVSQTLSSGTEIGSVSVNGTETKLYAPTGSGGSTVEVSPILGAGTLIASVTVDGTETQLYAPAGSEVSVTPILGTGTPIASVSVDGSITTLYAPESSGGSSGSTESYDWLGSLASEALYLSPMNQLVRSDGHMVTGYINFSVMTEIPTQTSPVKIGKVRTEYAPAIRNIDTKVSFTMHGLKTGCCLGCYIDYLGDIYIQNDGATIPLDEPVRLNFTYFIS